MTTSLASLKAGIAKFLRWQAVATNSCHNSNRRILKASHIVMSLVGADDIALVGIFFAASSMKVCEIAIWYRQDPISRSVQFSY